MTKKIVHLEKVAELLKIDVTQLQKQLVKIVSSLKNECKQ